MGKPQPKQEVSIKQIIKGSAVITIHATPDAINDLREFGNVWKWPEANHIYTLYVDARYDFAEVVAYIEAYGGRG